MFSTSRLVLMAEPELPVKRIHDKAQILEFKKSKAHSIYLKFILQLNESVKGKTNNVQCIVSPV